jgi:dihydrofolate reductase
MSTDISAEQFVERLESHRSPEEAKKYLRYFKIGEGEYGEGDEFMGVRMGQVFALAKEFIDMPPGEIEKLLESPIHEVRVGAVSIMDWLALDPESWAAGVERMKKSFDTILLGRANYEGFGGYWPAVADDPASTETDVAFSKWLDATSKVVFSTTLDKAEWQNSRLVQGNLEAEVQKLKQQTGKDILIMNSTSIGQQLMRAGLVDGYWLWVNPAIIGSGRPLFENINDRINLQLVEVQPHSSGSFFLRYRQAVKGKEN